MREMIMAPSVNVDLKAFPKLCPPLLLVLLIVKRFLVINWLIYLCFLEK
jgi:hypothetical protein